MSTWPTPIDVFQNEALFNTLGKLEQLKKDIKRYEYIIGVCKGVMTDEQIRQVIETLEENQAAKSHNKITTTEQG